MTQPGSGTRPDDARRHNRAVLLRRLHVEGPCTRATLAGELEGARVALTAAGISVTFERETLELPPAVEAAARYGVRFTS